MNIGDAGDNITELPAKVGYDQVSTPGDRRRADRPATDRAGGRMYDNVCAALHSLPVPARFQKHVLRRVGHVGYHEERWLNSNELSLQALP